MSKNFESENKPDQHKLMRPEEALTKVFQSVFETHIKDWLAKRSEVYSVNMQTAFAYKVDKLSDEKYAHSNIS